MIIIMTTAQLEQVIRIRECEMEEETHSLYKSIQQQPQQAGRQWICSNNANNKNNNSSPNFHTLSWFWLGSLLKAAVDSTALCRDCCCCCYSCCCYYSLERTTTTTINSKGKWRKLKQNRKNGKKMMGAKTSFQWRNRLSVYMYKYIICIPTHTP